MKTARTLAVVSTRFRRGLLTAVLLTMGQYCEPLAAQDAAAQSEIVEEITVTGSRLVRPSIESPTPLVQLGREALDLSGTTNVADNLNELPVFGTPAVTPVSSNFSSSGVGMNLVNLRGLGSSRTLVLVNGRRHVSGDAGSSAVDLNAIPADFVERTDIITGGASAIYGSEAIAGVVNIITSRDYEGLMLKAQGGSTSRSDGENYHLSATYGTKLGLDNAHLMLHAAYRDDGLIYSIDRDISRTDAFQNPDGSIVMPSRSGVTADGTFTFRLAGGGNRTVTQGPDGLYTAPLTQDNRFDRIVYRYVLLPVERQLVAGTFHIGLSDAVNFSVETSYSNTRATAESEPVAIGTNIHTLGIGGQSQALLNIPASNPFIPNEIRSIMDPAQTTIEYLGRPMQLGSRIHPNDRSSMRVAAGFDGTVFDDWRWDAYVQMGRSEEDARVQNLVNMFRYVEAINVEIGPDGAPRCIDRVARAEGCVPFNPFGRDAASEAAMDYLAAEARFESKITQQVAAVSISGAPFSLGARDVLLASGIEYRKEMSDFDSDPLTEAGMLSFGQQGDTVGKFDVAEVFAETSVPLVSDLGPINAVNLEGAMRLADYSTIGSTASWRAGAYLEFAGGVRLRGAYAEANRAPNIGELYSPQQGAGGRVTDPCAGGGVVSGLSPEAAARRIANCTALGIDSTFVPDQIALESTKGLQGGNPNLIEETANTLTAGLIYAPDYLQGFSATVDYWSIDVEEAIGTISRQVTVNQCVDQPSTDNAFCGNVSRDPVSRNILGVNTLIQNLSRQEVAGIDYGLTYNFKAGERNAVGLDLLATRLMTDDVQQFAGATVQERVQEIGRPEWRGVARLNFRRGPMSVAWQTRYVGEGFKDKNVTSAANKIDAVSYSDLQLRYRFDGGTEVYLGADNIFDKEAPIVASPHPMVDFSTQTVSEVYDPIGTRFYLGVTLRP